MVLGWMSCKGEENLGKKQKSPEKIRKSTVQRRMAMRYPIARVLMSDLLRVSFMDPRAIPICKAHIESRVF